MKIMAKGKVGNDIFTVNCGASDKKLYFVSAPDSHELKKKFYNNLKRQHLFAGTFLPDENSQINIYNVVKRFLFDELINIEVFDMSEEMPFEEGVIY